MHLEGVPIITDPPRPVYRQVRFPRTKKRRIRRKWEKDRGNWEFVEYERFAYAVNMGLGKQYLYMDTKTAEDLRRRLQE